MTKKIGGDEIVLDAGVEAVKGRLAEKLLGRYRDSRLQHQEGDRT